jgi:uncharacterized membrane protein YgaE (UPF0421/DUF939 family)
LSNIANWTGAWRESWPRMRQAIQTAVAACIAYAAADLLDLPQGFWAVMTAILVTQANVGASLGLATDRLLGSLLGVLVGGGVALILADSHALRYAGLAATILVLAFFSSRRPALRIACVTAAIVILGDPRLGPPISSAGYRMIEVAIGAVVSILTTLVLFPSRAGRAFADNVAQTLPPMFGLLASAVHTALGGSFDAALVTSSSAKVRAQVAASDALARESQLEVAGYLAGQSDPDAVLRTLRRLWHTEIMLLRSVAQPLPAAAVKAMRAHLEVLHDAVELLPSQCADAFRSNVAPDLSAVDGAIAALQEAVAGMRGRGELRELSIDEVMRLMTFDFALGQLRANLKDLADRTHDLAGLSGSAIPWLRSWRAWV